MSAISAGAGSLDNGVDEGEFERHYGESLRDVLDLSSWQAGTDLQDLYERLERQLGAAIAQEERVNAVIRRVYFPDIARRNRASAPPLAGVYQLTAEQIEKVHRGVLFCGDVEACDATMQDHDSLALTVIQLGVCLVSYNGDEGTWSHRLYHRDLRELPDDPVREIEALINARRVRGAIGRHDQRDRLSSLGRRGIMSYAERAILTRVAKAPWRMGHGTPVPFELLTGAGAVGLLDAALEVLEELLLQHRRFVYVPSTLHDRNLLTLGQALRPLEFAVVHTLDWSIQDIVEKGNWRGRQRDRALAFVHTVGKEVAMGIFRASSEAPPYIFFAPAQPDLCYQAAAIAMADAALQEQRGFPLLLDMADRFCRAEFGREAFIGTLQAAYAAHGRPVQYLSERETRT